MPLPAMSGAEPWTGSYMPGPPSSPRLAEGSIPSEPVSIADSSLRMSPNMFSVRITSKRDGSETSCIAALSTSRWSSSTSANSGATPSTVSRHRREVSSTLALSTDVTRGCSARARALSNATRAMRSISATVYSQVSKAPVRRARPSRRSRSRRSARARPAGRCPRSRSGRSGLACTSEGLGCTGRRLAYRPEALAKPEQALLGARRVGVGRVPLGAADGAEQDGVRARGRRPARRR